MSPSLPDPDRLRPGPLGVAAIAVLLVAGPALAGLATAWPPEAASPASGEPDGTAEWVDRAEQLGYRAQTTLVGADALEQTDPKHTLHVVVAPGGDEAQPGWDRIVHKARDGGRVLVLDRGQAAHLLEPWGWHLQANPVFNADVAAQDPSIVPTRWRVDDEVHRVPAATPLTLVPKSKDVEPTGTPIVTANESFADLDGDGTLDESDVRGPFTVGVDVVTREGGRLVHVTSPHPLTNDAARDRDAGAFREALLVSLLPDGGTVVVDVTRADRPPIAQQGNVAVQWATSVTGCTPCTAALLALVAIPGAYLAYARGGERRTWGAHEPNLREVAYPSDTEEPDAGTTPPDGATPSDVTTPSHASD